MEEITILESPLEIKESNSEEITPYMGWLCGLFCESGIICG